MRSKLLFALLGIAAMFTGCNNENVDDLAPGKKSTTSFNVSVDGGVQTRAAVTDLSRYVMEIYKGATATGTPDVHKEQATGTFTDVVLDDAQQYTILFWADYGTPTAEGGQLAAVNEYNASDLKAASIAKQPTKAAYAGLSRFTVGTDTEASYTSVTLNHAVAQVNFKQTEALPSATNTLTVTYPKSYSLNVGDSTVTEIAGVVTHAFTYDSKVAGTLGTDYIIAATSTPKTMLDITATLNGETAKVVSNVPFERNYKTNISGAYSNKYDATMTVTCDDTWGTPDNEFPYIEVDGIKVATGNLVFNSTTNKVEIGAATDGGLFFQFGSLVGWSETGDPTIAVKPEGCTVATTWSKSWTGDPTTDEAVAGTGDPCRYYLKGTWRLPTKDEYVALFKTVDESYQNGWSWDISSSSASHSSGLKIPASGSREPSGSLLGVGLFGAYWSASPSNSGNGYRMDFDSSSVTSTSYNRACGYAVRCVLGSN